MFVNRLTVDGADFFLPDPVTAIRDAILLAVRAGGGYVNLPSPRSAYGTDVLFSPGTGVLWTRIEVPDEPTAQEREITFDFTDFG